MIVKKCSIHGDLTEAGVYTRRREGRIERTCKACTKARASSHYHDNSEAIAVKRKTRYQDPAVRNATLRRVSQHYATDPEVKIASTRAYKLALKVEVLAHYSGGKPKCARCPVDEIRFLALDHIANDGRAHRRTGVKHMHLWAKKNGFPPVFQVLCHNCNTRKQAELRGPVKDSPSARHWAKARIEVLRRYSGDVVSCALCTESDLVVLTVDHVEGGGNEHRRSLASPSRLYSWLRRSGFPQGFRVLCQNHNLGARCLG